MSTGYRAPPFGLHGISFVRACGDSFKTVCLRYPGCRGGLKGRLSLARTEPSASHPARTRSAQPPRRAPPHPDPPVGCPGFRLDNWHSNASRVFRFGLKKILFARASKEISRMLVFGAMTAAALPFAPCSDRGPWSADYFW